LFASLVVRRVQRLKGLRVLYLENNSISALPSGVFSDLVNLDWLSHCRKYHTRRFFGISTALRQGRASHQAINHSQRVSSNHTSASPNKSLAGEQELTRNSSNSSRLNATRLPVDKSGEGTSSGNHTLAMRSIDSLPHSIFDGLPSLRVLHLHRNPLRCAPRPRDSKLSLFRGPPPCPHGYPARTFSCYTERCDCSKPGTTCPSMTFSEQGVTSKTACLECGAGYFLYASAPV